MQCWGGKDGNDCPMPDICIPGKGMLGNDGMECPVSCPAQCGYDEMKCGGSVDPWTGCLEPEWCMSSKGPMAKDGIMECPVSCPVKCGIDEVWCPGPVDENNGCIMPEMCMPKGSECPN